MKTKTIQLGDKDSAAFAYQIYDTCEKNEIDTITGVKMLKQSSFALDDSIDTIIEPNVENDKLIGINVINEINVIDSSSSSHIELIEEKFILSEQFIERLDNYNNVRNISFIDSSAEEIDNKIEVCHSLSSFVFETNSTTNEDDAERVRCIEDLLDCPKIEDNSISFESLI